MIIKKNLVMMCQKN